MKKIRFALIQLLLYIIKPFIKKKSNLVFFGSWCGELVIDNTLYLAKFFDSKKDLEMYWVGKQEIKDEVTKTFRNIKFLDMDKFSTLIKLMQASVIFYSQMLQGDFPRFNIYKKAIKIHLLHGLAIKKVYADAPNIDKESLLKRIYGIFLGSNTKDNYYISSSPILKHYVLTAFLIKEDDKVLEFGSPRNDYLINSTTDEKKRLIQKYSELLGCDLRNKRIILYSPTYRRLSSNNISLFNKDDKQTKKLLTLLSDENAVLIEKKHFAGIKSNSDCQIKKHDSFFTVDSIRQINFQELLLISDILISDYSGAILDFALLRKPQISYVFDYEYYKNVDSGLYFDVEHYSPGDIAYNYDELISKINYVLKNGKNQRSNIDNVIKTFTSFESGNCCLNIFNFLIHNNYLESK